MLLHSLSGSCPLGTTLQVPTEPLKSQASQPPLQALLQQTLSTQVKPESQSVCSSQNPPWPWSGTQAPASQ